MRIVSRNGETQDMTALNLSRFENLSRALAHSGSAIAALIFGICFATEKNFAYQTKRFLTGQDEDLGLPIFLCLLLAVFVGYVLAGKKQFVAIGSILTIGAVGAVYAWCQVELNRSPGPYLIVLACPALFHLLALMLHRQSLQGERASLQSQAFGYETISANAV